MLLLGIAPSLISAKYIGECNSSIVYLNSLPADLDFNAKIMK